MKNYQLAKIYKIVSNITNEIYVGSTCEPTLARRLAKHVGCYKHYLKGKFNYITSFKILELGNYSIILIENCPCENKDELHKRERYYIETLDCVNKIIPGRTQKEYRDANKDYQKDYYNSNIEKIKNRKYKHCYCVCCGGRYTYSNNSQHQKTEKHINSINNIKLLFKEYKNIKTHIDIILSDLSNQQFLQV
jgi:hypothetical protein